MNLPDLGFLALVEGVADILPIDASTHLMIVGRLLRLHAGSLMPALQLGVALALALFFWREMALITSGLLKLRKLRIEPGTRLLTKMLLAALPFLLLRSGIGGITLPDIGNVFYIGLITLICALLMIFSDRLSLTVKRVEHIGGLTSLAVGLAQALALIPGIGRVPAGMILARLFGMERTAAFRFVLLSSLPILLVEAIAGLVKTGRQPGFSDLLALLLSLLAALFALGAGFSLMRRSGLMPFAVYRMIIGAILIALSFF